MVATHYANYLNSTFITEFYSGNTLKSQIVATFTNIRQPVNEDNCSLATLIY